MESMSNSDEKSSHPSTSSMDRTEFSAVTRDSFSYCRTNSGMSAYSEPAYDSHSCSSEPSPSYWPGMRSKSHNQGALTRLGMKHKKHVDDEKPDDEEPMDLELEMMKEKFSKLLLGEDMSGSGKGVCTAVTLSNAITNLYATIFGHNLKLEPLDPEKKAIWKREMDCLLSVCDYIVDFVPAKQILQDGTAMEVMTTIQRSDLYINLPALKKLDMVLIDILDSFQHNEFWYNERGSMSDSSNRAESFRRVSSAQHTEEKWWLPVPCVPHCGLSENSRKHLIHKRDSANQIHKAAMAINSSILSEMEIPETYILNLPKNGKAKLGDSVYRYMSTVEKFSPDYLLDSLKIPSERDALELADRIESSMYTWRRKACLHHSKTSWSMVKEFTSETEQNDKNTILAARAESLLFCLKQRYPALSQTTLDASKIQYNKDVGRAVLESYSRVLEGLAFNIVAWIDEVLYADISVRSQNGQH